MVLLRQNTPVNNPARDIFFGQTTALVFILVVDFIGVFSTASQGRVVGSEDL
jgi:hypothetical protein